MNICIIANAPVLNINPKIFCNIEMTKSLILLPRNLQRLLWKSSRKSCPAKSSFNLFRIQVAIKKAKSAIAATNTWWKATTKSSTMSRGKLSMSILFLIVAVTLKRCESNLYSLGTILLTCTNHGIRRLQNVWPKGNLLHHAVCCVLDRCFHTAGLPRWNVITL